MVNTEILYVGMGELLY